MTQLSRTAGQMILALGMAAALWAAAISVAQAESISTFEVEYTIDGSSDVLVTERITYDFEGAERHGIFREVLNKHPQSATAWYKTRGVTYEVLSATRDGQPETYVNESSDGLYLRIGRADVTISGTHEYDITYKMTGALSTYNNQPELYWNVTGDSWQVPINDVVVMVTTTDGAELLNQQACYAGYSAATTPCNGAEFGTTTSIFSQSQLQPGEGLTIGQAVSLSKPATVIEHINWLPFVLGGFLVALVSMLISLLRWKYHYRTTPSIIAQYEPFEGAQPMFTGVLFDNRLDSRDITAGLITLAQQGFISIKQVEETFLGLFTAHDHEVTLKRPFEEASGRFAQDLLSLLFADQAPVGSTGGFKLFGIPVGKDPAAAALSVGKTIRLSDIKKNQPKLRSNYYLLQSLKKAVRADLLEKGFVEQGFILSRRTARGYEALHYLKGFKEFLSVTETERYKFHNAPSKNPQQFMEFLPYAIAFGVEKEWSEVFKDIAIDAPDWYSSDVPGGQFSAIVFANEIGAFSSSLASSGSSSSGSSGGGSVGGGGGGGGGGSW
ncbi:DUF2207 domain-containing protein [Candidatus Kaiserbacteria bacterium]|nr:DUF2207 domain-containing protein [Candidatus Kaiserbacteria bacterium]